MEYVIPPPPRGIYQRPQGTIDDNPFIISPNQKRFKIQIDDSSGTLRDIPIENVNGLALEFDKPMGYESQYKDANGTWQEVTTMPAWGTTLYECEYCGNTEVSKYGSCVGCGFTPEKA